MKNFSMLALMGLLLGSAVAFAEPVQPIVQRLQPGQSSNFLLRNYGINIIVQCGAELPPGTGTHRERLSS